MTASNRLLSASGALTRSYSYDAAGHVSADGSRTFAYNAAGRLIQATQGGASTAYVYNALGQRIVKSNAAGTRLFVYDEAGHLLGEYEAGGALIQETIWLGDTPVATLRPDGGGGVSLYYVHTDQLDAPRRISRPADNVILWKWEADPFGEARRMRIRMGTLRRSSMP